MDGVTRSEDGHEAHHLLRLAGESHCLCEKWLVTC